MARIDELPRHGGNLWEQPGLSELLPNKELRPLVVRLTSEIRMDLSLVKGLDLTVPEITTSRISDALYVQAGYFRPLTSEFGSPGAAARALVDRGYDGFVVVYLGHFMMPTGNYAPDGVRGISREAVRGGLAYEFEAWKQYRQKKADFRFQGVRQSELPPPGAPIDKTSLSRQPDPGPGSIQVPPRRKRWFR